jgi:hypothetical protein
MTPRLRPPPKPQHIARGARLRLVDATAADSGGHLERDIVEVVRSIRRSMGICDEP